MSIKRRIFNGAIVTALGIGLSAVAQLISVPVLTTSWGSDRYGVWLMLTTLPAYFALSDLGFASAATADMTAKVALGETDQAKRTLNALFGLVNIMSGILLIVIAIALAISAISSPGTQLHEFQRYAYVLLCLVAYSCFAMNGRVALAGLRATRNFADSTLLADLLTFLEVLLLLLAAWLGFGFFTCALVLAAVRFCNTASLWRLLRVRAPWLSIHRDIPIATEMKRLWRPALAAMAIPASLALSLQGMVLIAGLLVSASAAATFAATRTVSRLAIQVVGAINRASMPELSAADALSIRSTITKIMILNIVSTALILIPGAVIFTLIGSTIIATWTNGHITPSTSFVGLVATAMVLHGLWYYLANLLLASNKHTGVAGSLVIISVVSIAAAIPAAQLIGLDGVAGCLVVSEFVCLVQVIRSAVARNLLSFTELAQALQIRFWRPQRGQ